MIDKMTLQKIRDEAYDAQVANKKYVASKKCFSKFAIIFFVLMILTGVLSFLSKSYDNIINNIDYIKDTLLQMFES